MDLENVEEELIKVEYVKKNLRESFLYIKAFLKWILVAVVVGALGGVVGSAFHLSIDYVTELRAEHSWLLFLLPVGGLVIAGIYEIFRSTGKIDTNRVLEAVGAEEKVPLVMAPLIFISTVITHLLGGSAGREGAALQLGGSIGYNLGKVFRLNKNDIHIIVMAGMSSVFAALFGTPLAAAFFALEVTCVGVLHYAGLVPCLIAAATSYYTAIKFGVLPIRFKLPTQLLSFDVFAKVIVLALVCAIVSIVFCVAIKKTEDCMEKLIRNKYLRAFAGGAIIVTLSLILRTYDYNGAGMDVISRAMAGNAKGEAFVLKIVFTAITIAAGFKGGEIVPTLFIGSTLGCVLGPILGLNAGFAAGIGAVALFCGVVNCPVASVLLALEIFGADGILLFALACGVSYMMSGNFGLYKSQKIVYSKFDDEYIDKNTK